MWLMWLMWLIVDCWWDLEKEFRPIIRNFQEKLKHFFFLFFFRFPSRINLFRFTLFANSAVILSLSVSLSSLFLLLSPLSFILWLCRYGSEPFHPPHSPRQATAFLSFVGRIQLETDALGRQLPPHSSPASSPRISISPSLSLILKIPQLVNLRELKCLQYVSSKVLRSSLDARISYSDKKVLVLDLDDTLVHSTVFPLNTNFDFTIKTVIGDDENTFYVYERPHLQTFLQKVGLPENLLSSFHSPNHLFSPIYF